MLRSPRFGSLWICLLLTAVVIGIRFGLASKSPVWAASVLKSDNQTVPPFPLRLNLPQITAPLKLINLTESLPYEGRPTWSPDGKHIALLRRDNQTGIETIYLATTDGSSPAIYVADGFAIAWSPDSTKLAFGSIRDGNNEIYVYEVANGHLTNLTNSAKEEVGPVWSPDGRKIAYRTVYFGNFDAELYVMNGDGSQKTEYADDVAFGANSGPNWSPDGSKIVFIGCLGSNSAICIVDADGSSLARLTTDTYGEYAAWSPKGSKIAFSGLSAIYSILPDGSHLTNLTRDFEIVVQSGPLWSSDGNRLFFTTSRMNPEVNWPPQEVYIYELYVMNADGNQRRRIRGLPDDRPIYAWRSADNKSLLLAFGGEIYSVADEELQN